MYRTATSVALKALVLSAALADNPVSTPIIHGGFSVQTRKFAKLPGESAKIVYIISLRKDLYVCTLHAVYRINPQGVVSLYLDVDYAFSASTNWFLNFFKKMHGGVRSIAFHPNFAQNGRIYIAAMESRPTNPRDFYYLSDAQKPIKADGVLLEFIHDVKTGVPNVFTYRNVFRVGMPFFDHPIKQIAFFGNYLYIAYSDGSFQYATAGGGQKNDALGKILRINPLRQGRLPFTVPPGNPFINKMFMLNEIYAMGFRNPHTISFGKDGRILGGNYGCPNREGTFAHKSVGGLVTGVFPLHANDAAYGYIYPAAEVGHKGKEGAGFVGQAVAGGCPVENGSPMGGKYHYDDFHKSGNLFFSITYELKHARTTGPPWQLSQACTIQAFIYYEQDGFPGSPPLRFNTLGDVVKHDAEQVKGRVDVRMGRSPRGELY
ncbi:Glucose/Sorbosone dehydrogenase [Gracilaria domingensis]|nr:Glucose/Sorbosone dehydrogenase [Gracilaria domingensis]